MKLAIPILEDQGLNSPLCAHLGRSPYWLLMDSQTNTFAIRRGSAMPHSCRSGLPFAASEVEVILCFRVGAHHFQQLRQQGILIYRTRERTAAEALEKWQNHELPPITEAGPARIPCPSL